MCDIEENKGYHKSNKKEVVKVPPLEVQHELKAAVSLSVKRNTPFAMSLLKF